MAQSLAAGGRKPAPNPIPNPIIKALWLTVCAGAVFAVLNATMRHLALRYDPYQVQFLRYLLGFVLIVPIALRIGLGRFQPSNVGGHFTRGLVHTVGLVFWFTALPKIALADMTAIGFTGPIFIMLGAWLFFKEPMHWERWAAAAIGFAGVLVVVGPKLTGHGGLYNLLMLASAPMFAASFLLTKALTKSDRVDVIVFWQGITVSMFSLPLALLHWQWPTPFEWMLFALCGLMGSAAHWCLTKSFQIADISATQSVKFLDLVWSVLLGWAVFAQVPTQSTLIGGVVICSATIWIARREAIRNKARSMAHAERDAAQRCLDPQ
jgi:drug/metabolite transporter (DMT)-like permease